MLGRGRLLGCLAAAMFGAMLIWHWAAALAFSGSSVKATREVPPSASNGRQIKPGGPGAGSQLRESSPRTAAVAPARPIWRADCRLMMAEAGVLPGVSWGTLDAARQQRWRALRCDELLAAAGEIRPVASAATAYRGAASVASAPPARASRGVVVYRNGFGGYRVFRIPALARAGRTLLAFAEARPTVDDHGRIDLVVRRSTDGGKSWGELQVVASGRTLPSNDRGGGGGETVGNPVPIYLRGSRELLLLFCSNPARVTEDFIRGGTAEASGLGRRVWITRSLDAGMSWETPREVTQDVKRPPMNWYATGPGGAVVLRNGTLLVPAAHSDALGPVGSGGDHSHVLVSHDGGRSWRLGGIGEPNGNEATLAVLADGRLLLNSRGVDEVSRQRILQTSADGGASWQPAWRPAELVEPPPHGCHGSMVSTRAGALFFSHIESPMARARLTIRRSDDGGITWPRVQVLHEGPAAYSSMKLLPDAELAVLSERGLGPAAFFAQQVVFERVPLGEDSPLGPLK